MASINDFGGADPDRLDSPPLGGPDGWAAAVAAALNGDDTGVDERIAAHEAKADPHPGYLTPAEHAALDHTGLPGVGGGGGASATLGASVTTSTQTTLSPAATPIAIVWDAERWDDAGFWSAADPTRMHIPADGRYHISGRVIIQGMSTAAGSDTLIWVYINGGAQTFIVNRLQGPNPAGQVSFPFTLTVNLEAGDTVQVLATHSGNSTSFVRGALGAQGQEFTVVRLADGGGGTSGLPPFGLAHAGMMLVVNSVGDGLEWLTPPTGGGGGGSGEGWELVFEDSLFSPSATLIWNTGSVDPTGGHCEVSVGTNVQFRACSTTPVPTGMEMVQMSIEIKVPGGANLDSNNDHFGVGFLPTPSTAGRQLHVLRGNGTLANLHDAVGWGGSVPWTNPGAGEWVTLQQLWWPGGNSFKGTLTGASESVSISAAQASPDATTCYPSFTVYTDAALEAPIEFRNLRLWVLNPAPTT